MNSGHNKIAVLLITDSVVEVELETKKKACGENRYAKGQGLGKGGGVKAEHRPTEDSCEGTSGWKWGVPAAMHPVGTTSGRACIPFKH